MNRSVTRLAHRLSLGALLLGAPALARAGTCDDSPARCTRPATPTATATVAAASRPVTPSPAPVRMAPVTPRVATPVRIVRPTAAPAAPSLTLKRSNAAPTDKLDRAADKAGDTDSPAVPGLGRLLRINAGTDDEISWLRTPRSTRERGGAIVT